MLSRFFFRVWRTLFDGRVQHLEYFLQLGNHLPDQLLVLGRVVLYLVATEFLLGATDGVALVIEQAPNLANGNNIRPLIIPAVAPAFYRRQLGKLLFPIAKYVRFYRAQLRHLTDGEIALPRNRGKFVVMTGFQHTLLLFALVFVPGET